MRKILVLALVVVVSLAMAAPVFAVMSGKTVEFDVKDAGKVIFDGKIHADKGLKCKDCHPAVFKMKKGGDVITMKDMDAGKNCGTCHDGKKAFSSSDKAACVKCHKK